MIQALHDNLKIPVTCKIRIMANKEKTIELAKRYFNKLLYIEYIGCWMLFIVCPWKN